MSVLHTINLAKDRALTATFKTRWVDSRSAYSFRFQMSSDNTGTPVGAWTIEETNDPVADFENRSTDGDSTASTARAINISADTTRVTILGTGLTVNAANDTEVIIINPAQFLRLVYTRTSGGTGSKAQIWGHGRE